MMPPFDDYYEIVEKICAHLTNTENSFAIILDGSSCTFKSSILSSSRKDYDLSYIKVQRFFRYTEINHFFPSTIGYICRGLNLLNKKSSPPITYLDRSPFNPLDWNILWKLIHCYQQRYGNVECDEVLQESYFDFFDAICQAHSQCTKSYTANMNCIVLLNTNVEQVRCLRKKRNVGSDSQRCKWLFYDFLQNRFYKNIYPNTYIDLAEIHHKISRKRGDHETDNCLSHLDETIHVVREMLRTIHNKAFYKNFKQKRLNFNADSETLMTRLFPMIDCKEPASEEDRKHQNSQHGATNITNPNKRIKLTTTLVSLVERDSSKAFYKSLP